MNLDGAISRRGLAWSLLAGLVLAWAWSGELVRAGDKRIFWAALVPGKGWLIMTYIGINADPVPIFGEPAYLMAERRADGMAFMIHFNRPTAKKTWE